ncbi:mechanosensitive ion channel family protein [Thalassospira marina]|uniref:Mechanosensitive ion channel protein MscS n=1 Tax=Thalassospira marina TaxID=2048283 RepID=A0ABN5FE68_9PROT|nr:mechanosensitive ion channel family protein [Thalassospira marina]AUG52868.1 mechanosensitive ion channel protein MscS [Thalassospira marina]
MEEVTSGFEDLNDKVVAKFTDWADMVGGGDIGRAIVAIVILLFFITIRKFLAHGVVGGIRRLADQHKHQTMAMILDALQTPIEVFVVLLGIYFSVEVMEFSDKTDAAIFNVLRVFVIATIFWAFYRVVEPLALGFNTFAGRFGAGLADDLRQFFIRCVRTLVVVLAGVALLEDWGIDVSAFLGGLGLAGMAVALAAKDSVANVFGGLTIFADKLFKRGDWIETPHFEGVVEFVGLRATKVRTFSKAMVVMPNAEIVDSPVINWSRMTHRRIKMVIGVEYRTSADQIEKIIERLRNFLQQDEDVAQEDVPQMVHLADFGSSSINIDLYYFTNTTDWQEWRDIRNRHIIAFKRIIEEEGASFAFPSQSLYVESMPDMKMSRASANQDDQNKHQNQRQQTPEKMG